MRLKMHIMVRAFHHINPHDAARSPVFVGGKPRRLTKYFVHHPRRNTGNQTVQSRQAQQSGKHFPCRQRISLCTDHCITESYDIAFECYRQMIGLYGVRNVSACGFSSGGTLAIGIAYNNAIRGELPQPRHIVAVSPGIAVYETLKTVGRNKTPFYPSAYKSLWTCSSCGLSEGTFLRHTDKLSSSRSVSFPCKKEIPR